MAREDKRALVILRDPPLPWYRNVEKVIDSHVDQTMVISRKTVRILSMAANLTVIGV